MDARDTVELAMAHPKLSTASHVLTPRFRPRPQQANSLSSADDLAVVRIAERFAPAARSSPGADDRVFDQKVPPPVTSLGSRGLVVALFFVSLLPSLLFGAILGLGLVRAHRPATMKFGGESGLLAQWASVAEVWLPAMEPSRSTKPLPVVLAAPAILKAKAGHSTSLALALSRTDALPARSIIAIQGLPPGSTMSSGRPYGEGGWNLRADEIGRLRLILPKAAEGAAALEIRVVTPGGEDIASAKTLLKVVPETDSSEVAAVSQHNEPAAALNEGIQPFVADATPQVSYDTMLALGATPDAIVASRSPPMAELPASPTADRLQESAPNRAAAKPANTDYSKVQEGPATAKANSAQTQDDDAGSRVVLTAFVNLRESPSSSSRVLGVMEKDSEFRVIGQKRAWLKVTDAANSQTGWIYSRYAASRIKSRRANREALPSTLGSSKSDSDSKGSFWTQVGRWVAGP
jgi:hypothetical protein